MDATKKGAESDTSGQRSWRRRSALSLFLGAVLAVAVSLHACDDDGTTEPEPLDPTLVAQGKTIFRFETFGDESFWTDTLRLHEIVQASVSPTLALQVGLKVDADTLPQAVKDALSAGQIDLNSPATTVTLLKLGAVVGLRGTVETVNGKDTLVRLGTTCALCHSTVDNSFAPGIGRRLDGWPNLQLNPGAIIALSPAITADQKTVYNSWGPGKYDPRFNIDGQNGPVYIPPAYGLRDVPSVTFTGDGNEVAYWNRYVAVTQMHGHGTFSEPRLSISVENLPDLVEAKLPALQAYQLSLEAPSPPAGSFDAAAAERGRAVFNGNGQCNSCHQGARLTDADERLHSPAEVVSEPEPSGTPSYASRSATKMYRTTPLRALWQHPPYFHNGVAATLEAVVELYNARKGLNLTAQQKADLVEYLKSL